MKRVSIERRVFGGSWRSSATVILDQSLPGWPLLQYYYYYNCSLHFCAGHSYTIPPTVLLSSVQYVAAPADGARLGSKPSRASIQRPKAQSPSYSLRDTPLRDKVIDGPTCRAGLLYRSEHKDVHTEELANSPDPPGQPQHAPLTCLNHLCSPRKLFEKFCQPVASLAHAAVAGYAARHSLLYGSLLRAQANSLIDCIQVNSFFVRLA